MASKEKIIRYVLHTPNNPNRKVLETLLDSYLENNGGTVSTDKTVVIIPTDNGTTTISPVKPIENDRVTITANPKTNYVLNELILADINGNKVSYTDNGNGTFTYTQPKQTTIIIANYGEDVTIWDGGGVEGW